jgi:hypothetical protein
MSEFFATNATDPPYSTLNSCFGAFCTVWEHLGPFSCLTKLSSKRAELGNSCNNSCHEVILEFFAMIALNQPYWTLNSCFGAFRTLWVHLGPFCCLTKLVSNRSELVQLMQKFVPRSRVRIFNKECTQSTPFYPKLMLWCVSYILDVFWTIWLQHKTRC